MEAQLGGSLRTVLDAQSAVERAGAVRGWMVHLLALSSGPLWVAAAWPGWFSALTRQLSLAAWGAFVVGLGGALAEEIRCRRRLVQVVAALEREPRPGP